MCVWLSICWSVGACLLVGAYVCRRLCPEAEKEWKKQKIIIFYHTFAFDIWCPFISEESFATLIAIIFIKEAFSKLAHIIDANPVRYMKIGVTSTIIVILLIECEELRRVIWKHFDNDNFHSLLSEPTCHKGHFLIIPLAWIVYVFRKTGLWRKRGSSCTPSQMYPKMRFWP